MIDFYKKKNLHLLELPGTSSKKIISYIKSQHKISFCIQILERLSAYVHQL